MGEASSTHLYTAAQYAALPYELLDHYCSDPAWFLQGWRQAWTGIAVRLLFQPLPALCNLRVKLFDTSGKSPAYLHRRKN
jgi:hypothetical protein